MHVDQLTGEVTAEIAGKTFRLHATMPRMAALQTALGVDGIAAIDSLLQGGDARAVYHALRCLCSSGNAADFDSMLLLAQLRPALKAVRTAMVAGLPDEAAGQGNAAALTA